MIFVRQGNMYILTEPRDIEQLKVLPAGNYVVKYKEDAKMYYLETIESFSEPEKLYGEVDKMSDRILRTYAMRESSTGVVFFGEKGSGKTLTAKMVSIKAAKSGIPTLVINSPWNGPEFNQFIQGIIQPTIVFFDEFEKTFDAKVQENLLTLLDGVFPSKKLFMFTCNDKYQVDSHMNNRPSRIFYSIAFTGVGSDLIEEYCEQNLDEKTHIPAIKRIAALFEDFNFDMLKSLVEEMNRYEETPLEAIKWLNAKPEYTMRDSFDVTLLIDGKTPVGHIERTTYTNPLRGGSFSITHTVDKESQEHYFSMADLKQINGNLGVYVYVKGNVQLTLTRRRAENFDMEKHRHLLDSDGD